MRLRDLEKIAYSHTEGRRNLAAAVVCSKVDPYRMMILDPRSILQDLTTGDPVRLDTLPRDQGIYALHDHSGAIRYIGITKKDRGFYDRINNRHVTGSEGRSHKFSHGYNTGRMWRSKKDDRPDAKLARVLRRTFIRRYCRATFVAVPPTLWKELPKLEAAVQAMAPKGTLDWGGKRGFNPLPEPKDLVDAIIDEIRFTPDQRAAVQRQAALCAAG